MLQCNVETIFLQNFRKILIKLKFETKWKPFLKTRKFGVFFHFNYSKKIVWDVFSQIRPAGLRFIIVLKFVSDILLDAWQCARNRQNKEHRNTGSKNKDPRKNVLTMDDLQQATSKIGITLRKPPYYH